MRLVLTSKDDPPLGHWPILAPLHPPSPKREAPVPIGKSRRNTDTPPFDNSRSHEHKPRNTGSEEKKTPATEKPTTGAKAEGNPPASPKLTAAAAQKKKTYASTKLTRKTTKTTASSKPAPKKPAVKKPTAKQLPKKDATKESRRTSRLPPKRTDVLLPGPQEEVTSDSFDTDTTNSALVTGAGPPIGDASQAPRAQTSPTGPAASANSATTPLPKRSPSPDPSLRMDYEESESDLDREAGEVEGSGRSPPLTDEQRVLHPGRPMSPKIVAAIARARVLEEALCRRDDPPPATPESQVITKAGVNEGVHPELLRLKNRQRLSDRSRQAASQTIGSKNERESPAPRTREQLLGLRYWTREAGHHHYQADEVEPATGVVSDQDAQRRQTGSRSDLESLLVCLESCQRLLDGQRTEMVALRARVQEVETHMDQDVRRDSDRLRDHVWGLPGQICRLGDEVDRLRDRCSQGEENDGSVRQDLGRHLAWIRSLYVRVGRLETQDARRVAALAAAPTPAPAQVPSEQFVRVMADAFRQYSVTQSTPQAQQPPPGDRASKPT
ncbi:unnamed protein product [Phytophthora fragariaefolia]|uniref:Unnamed protein product n=1 Tax=Phytophthora fragariaefolia TaxID=1490495 RepID=A0A9W7D3K9_9STRA|nr:unnamed protein product [Phytophthora fragariaefolia]